MQAGNRRRHAPDSPQLFPLEDDVNTPSTTATTETAGEKAVWAALQEVDDPEIPGLSVVDLGIIRSVRSDANGIKVEAMPTFEFIRLLGSVSGGDHIEDERVAYFRARELDLRFDRTIKVNTDGEVLETDRCRYRVLPRAARFLCGDAPFASQ